jgi:hypothetical protein
MPWSETLMRQDQKNGNLLSSWKEISEFLKCDVKTCRRWERSAGLPVHRVSDLSKSRVFAYREELDAWVRKRAAGGVPVRRPVPRKSGRRLGLGLGLGLGVAALILVSIWVAFLRPGSHRLPVDFRIDRSELVMLDSKGREVWRYDTKLDNLEDDAAYRYSFQVKKPAVSNRGRILSHLIIRDINNDQKPEVLFCERTQDDLNAGLLLCFDFRGRELWRFQAGKEMKYGSRIYSNDYMIHGIEASDLDGDGSLEVLAIAFQRPDWPTQLVLLDARGKTRGEYWHSGQLNDYAIVDLDKDGRKDIILAGVNNEYEKGCVVVFSADRIEGGSPQSKDEFTCPDLKPGSEKYYLLFPKTDVDLVQTIVEAVGRISLLSSEKLEAEMVHSGIYYILDFSFRVEDLIFSHSFIQMHREARRAGQVGSVLDDKYREELIKGLLYYDGRGWTPTPTPVRRGPESGR